MIYIFDKQLNSIGLLENYFSLRWTRKYYKAGEFELHCALTMETLELLKMGNIIWKNDDIEAGYIEHRELKTDAEGKEILVVRGKLLTGLLGNRIIWGTENLNSTAENAIRTLVNNHAINPSNNDRKIPLLELSELKGYNHNINYQVSYANLLEELEKLAKVSGLGYRIRFDPEDKALKFEVFQGLDRTLNQSVNSPALFAKEFENILEQEYIHSLSNYKNVVLVAGEGEGSDRKLVTVGQSIGLDRREVFADARNSQSEEMTEQEYLATLEEDGNVALAEMSEIETFDSKINLKSNLKYKQDFDLGDKVTIANRKWGIVIETRITEVEEIYEEKGLEVNVTFGNNIPTLIEKLRQVVN